MKNNPFNELISICFEHIKLRHDQEAHSYLSTFSLVLWKMLSERTGDKEFNQTRAKAVVKEMTAELIHKGMTRFDEAYPEVTKGIFSMVLRHISYYNEDGGALRRLLDYLDNISLRNIFEQGSTEDYIEALHNAGFKKHALSGFSVPVYMLRLMRATLSIQEKDRVFAFGCAPVISILDSIVSEKSSYLCAQDMNVLFSIAAKIHPALFNIDHSRIAPQGLFEQPAFVKDGQLETFDCVFGVPHLGTITTEQAEKLRNDPYGRFPDMLFDRLSRELVTLAHALKVLKPKVGRGAILLPQKFLSMMSTHKIRSYMVLMNYIDTIATLPRYLFPGLTTDLALLVFKMNKQDKKVYFIDAEPFCSQADRSIDQDRFMELYAGKTKSEHSMLVDNSVILGREASLFPSVYQEVKPDKERKSLQHLRDELSGIDHRLQLVQKKLNDALGRMIES